MRRAFVWLFLIGLLSAQIGTIVAVRDGVWVQSYSKWILARAGMKLTYEDRVKIDTLGYLALILPGGKAVEVKKPGIYTIEDFKVHSSDGRDAISARYTGYVLNQAIAAGQGRPSGKTLGAVTRSPMAPVPLTPNKAYFYADSVILQWNRVIGAGGYMIYIEDYTGAWIASIQVPAETHKVVINMRNIVSSQNCYYWSISTLRYPSMISQKYCFYILLPEEEAKIKAEENLLINSLDETQAISHAILGSFYEDKKMYGYAFIAYSRASQIEPEVEIYSRMRDNLSKKTY